MKKTTLVLILLLASTSLFAKWVPNESTKRMLFKQVREANYSTVTKYLKNYNMEPDIVDPDGTMSLFNAVVALYAGHMTASEYSLLELLHEKGADIEKTYLHKYTPITSAAQDCDKELTIYLISKGASLNRVVYWYHYPENSFFLSAAKRECLDLIKYMHKYYDLDITDKETYITWELMRNEYLQGEDYPGPHQDQYRWLVSTGIDQVAACKEIVTGQDVDKYCEEKFENFIMPPMPEDECVDGFDPWGWPC